MLSKRISASTITLSAKLDSVRRGNNSSSTSVFILWPCVGLSELTNRTVFAKFVA